MDINNYFKTPIWAEEKLEYLKSLTKATDKYIKAARTRDRKIIKCTTDFGYSSLATLLVEDNNFRDFRDYIGQKSWEFLDQHGYDMKQYEARLSELWVQEFSKNGGGCSPAHIDSNQHVSGFYFLKCSDKTSYPVFHEPRTGARATKLKMKPNVKGIMNGTDTVHFKPTPGTLIIFPGYLEYEFVVDPGKAPFRFMHWSLSAIPKELAKDV